MRAREPLSEGEKIHQIRVFQGERFHAVSEVFAGDVVAVTGLRS